MPTTRAGIEASRRVAAAIIRAKGILNLLLGIVHIVGTFTFERANIAGVGSARLQRDYLIWFTGVGAFIIFMALIDVVCSAALKAGDALSWRLCLLCSLFTALLGAFGVTMFGVSPPLQLLVTGFVALGVLWRVKPTRSALARAAGNGL